MQFLLAGVLVVFENLDELVASEFAVVLDELLIAEVAGFSWLYGLVAPFPFRFFAALEDILALLVDYYVFRAKCAYLPIVAYYGEVGVGPVLLTHANRAVSFGLVHFLILCLLFLG